MLQVVFYLCVALFALVCYLVQRLLALCALLRLSSWILYVLYWGCHLTCIRIHAKSCPLSTSEELCRQHFLRPTSRMCAQCDWRSTAMPTCALAMAVAFGLLGQPRFCHPISRKACQFVLHKKPNERLESKLQQHDQHVVQHITSCLWGRWLKNGSRNFLLVFSKASLCRCVQVTWAPDSGGREPQFPRAGEPRFKGAQCEGSASQVAVHGAQSS